MKTQSIFQMPALRLLPFGFVLMSFFISTVLMAQDEPYYVKPLDGLNLKEAELITSGGSLSVYGGGGEKARLEVYIKSNNNKSLSKSEIEERLKERYELIIEASSDKVKAHAKQKNGWTDWKNALSISFKLYVPSRINSDLKTSGGSITLKGLDGNHDFTTSGGSLNVENVKGNIDGKTSGGSITVKGSEGKINLKTSGGSITAENSKGEIDLATSGGSLKLGGLEGKIEATTSGGSVSVDAINGELLTKTSGGSIKITRLKGSVDAGTSGGSVSVDIDQLGNYVKLRTSAGSIDLNIPSGKGVDLDLSGMKVNVPNLGNFSGSASESQLKGSVNGGGVPVTAKASAGKVNLSFEKNQ
jgi:DUF4097 and DUF4098 domain-containing protein YvlB